MLVLVAVNGEPWLGKVVRSLRLGRADGQGF
jgi:hypothetical protein